MIVLLVALVLLGLLVANVALSGAALTAGMNRSFDNPQTSQQEKASRRRIS